MSEDIHQNDLSSFVTAEDGLLSSSKVQKCCHKNKELKNRQTWETTTMQSTPRAAPRSKAFCFVDPAEQAAARTSMRRQWRYAPEPSKNSGPGAGSQEASLVLTNYK